ncbi:MAG TPA: hypothetical protein VFN38_03475 [Gemmatimonadaceae bacterium]|nr:hypothetical protein [Gemmatimonadaceae bacterium]
MSRCRLVDGRTPAEVRKRLGPPESVRRSGGSLTWEYGDALTIAFDEEERVGSVITDR